MASSFKYFFILQVPDNFPIKTWSSVDYYFWETVRASKVLKQNQKPVCPHPHTVGLSSAGPHHLQVPEAPRSGLKTANHILVSLKSSCASWRPHFFSSTWSAPGHPKPSSGGRKQIFWGGWQEGIPLEDMYARGQFHSIAPWNIKGQVSNQYFLE